MTSAGSQPSEFVLIAGFGIPGRFIAELLDYRGIAHCVIEQNSAVAERNSNTSIITGDARDPDVLQQAGLGRATLVAVTLPAEDVVHEVVRQVRMLRPDVHVIARANYTSAGLMAQRLGANQVVVEEQLAAREFFRLIEVGLNSTPALAATPAVS